MKIFNVQNNMLNVKLNTQKQSFKGVTPLILQTQDSFISSKGQEKVESINIDKLPNPIKSLARDTFVHFQNDISKFKTIPTLELSNIENQIKNASTKELPKLALNTSLYAKQLFIDAMEANDKTKLEDSAKMLKASLKAESFLNRQKAANHILTRSLDLAKIHLILNEPEKAEKTINENFKPSHNIKEDYNASIKVLNIQLGLLYAHNDNHEKALPIFQKLLTEFENTYNEKGITRMNLYMGNSYLNIGKYDKALQKLKPVLKYYNAEADITRGTPKIKASHKMRATTNSLIGECYLGKEKPEKALPHFKKACYLAKSKMEKTHTYRKIADVYSLMKNDNKAATTRAYAMYNYLSSSHKTLNDDFMQEIKKEFQTDVVRLQQSKLRQSAITIRFDNKISTLAQLKAFIQKHFTPEVQKG